MIKDQIRKTIQELQEREDIRVLYACESGSRAWGFESPDSDYDLRFIYVHSSDWYLEIQEKRDTIDLMLPNDLDLSGWELRKALRLFSSCNLALNEWLGSPEIYWEESGFRNSLIEQIPNYFNPRKALHHYLSMARSTAESSFDGNQIKIKKLFYILRPLLARQWVLKHRTMPPTKFQTLLDEGLIEDKVDQKISEIQERKQTAIEGEIVFVVPVLKEWVLRELSALEEAEDALPGSQKPGWEVLNQIMREWTSN
ncbi:MAG: nucleotidyltransferase domain-containing protein [Opitutales bacterium]|jgi:hypothetical protein|nr:nucleotidyltransferase domain-containing protein [Opitutales bacterium]